MTELLSLDICQDASPVPAKAAKFSVQNTHPKRATETFH
jgi:hypothetical protein